VVEEKVKRGEIKRERTKEPIRALNRSEHNIMASARAQHTDQEHLLAELEKIGEAWRQLKTLAIDSAKRSPTPVPSPTDSRDMHRRTKKLLMHMLLHTQGPTTRFPIKFVELPPRSTLEQIRMFAG
jgi:hypothetical protein